MRFWTSLTIVPLLVLLLVVTTPVGTGAGVHQFDLLHPLLPHAHLINGRLVTHDQLEREGPGSSQAGPFAQPPGPSLGADAGAQAADPAFALNPTLSLQSLHLLDPTPERRVLTTLRPPPGRTEAPPDPPPTSTA